MENSLLSVILDIAVLAGLGLTILYCVRLSRALNNFRQYRQEFNTLVTELSRNIDQASGVIDNLKNASFEAGEDLQKVVQNARKLTDELQLMNDMGNSLANRLERLSETGRGAVNQKPDFGDETVKPAARNGKAAEPAKKSTLDSGPAFFIQDREFEKGGFDEDDDFGSADLAEEDDGFDSQAERELYQALMKNNKGKSL
jgi:ABC-type transporter Mla subunit MlaD